MDLHEPKYNEQVPKTWSREEWRTSKTLNKWFSNKEITKVFGNFSCSISLSNFALSFSTKFDYAMHAPTRSPTTSKCLKHPILGSLGPIFVHKNNLFQVVNLQPTPPKCKWKFQQWKKSSPFWFGLGLGFRVLWHKCSQSFCTRFHGLKKKITSRARV